MRNALILATVVSASLFSGAAKATCMKKTPDGMPLLIAVVSDSDKQLFADRGFIEVACPAGTNVTQEKIDAACRNFNAYPPEQKSAFQQHYGLTVDQYCSAARDYLATEKLD